MGPHSGFQDGLIFASDPAKSVIDPPIGAPIRWRQNATHRFPPWSIRIPAPKRPFFVTRSSLLTWQPIPLGSTRHHARSTRRQILDAPRRRAPDSEARDHPFPSVAPSTEQEASGSPLERGLIDSFCSSPRS